MFALVQTAQTQSAAEARTHVWGDYFLADPWFLVLIPLGLCVLWYGRSPRARAAGRIPSLPAKLASLPRSWQQRFSWVAGLLQVLALVLVVVCLARPVRGNELRTTTSEGVDIVLAVDRSSSMEYTDLDPRRTRLDVVKEVVGDFAVRRMTDRVGAADNVALMTFARYPQLLCPFTLDAGALTEFLESVEVVRHDAENGTGIGRALAKAVALVAESDAQSRVVVLLSDGENNVADILPSQAAEMAAEQGVRVYTILAGRYQHNRGSLDAFFATERELDSTEMEHIARVTGGEFYRAKDKATLEQIYARIEELERTKREEQRFTETFDLYPLLLLPALALYLLAWLSSATWARRLP